MATATTEERGQRYIALYKSLKGAAQLILAASLAACILAGETERLAQAAMGLRFHGTGAWSIRLAHAITRRHLELTALALALDGVLTSVEGWALRRRHTWGEWLVVITTSSLLPFELVALFRHMDLLRVLTLVLNVAIVVFLVRKASRETRRHLVETHSSPSGRC